MNIKRFIIMFISVTAAIVCSIYLFFVFGGTKDFKYKSENAYIDDYKINIKVNENNTYNVDETAYKKFIEEGNTLYRVFSLKNENNNRVKIEDFKANNKMKYYMKKDKFIFKIINPNTVTGTLGYNFNYLYNVGKDKNKNYDEFYYNLLGENFAETVDTLRFNIEFPKKIDYKNVECYVLNNGKKDLSKIVYNINEKEIEGKLVKPLEPSEQIIIRVKLPDNYFVGAGYNYNMLDVIYFTIPLFGLLISIILLFKEKKYKNLNKVINKYPPEKLNVIELGALYKGKSEYIDILPEFIDLANKGYIKIVETKFGFKIIKLKEYDGKNKREKQYFENLFLGTFDNTADRNSIIDSFVPTHGKVLKIGDEFIKNKQIFKSIKNKKSLSLIILLVVSLIMIFITPAIKYGIFEQSFNSINAISCSNIIILDIVLMFIAFSMYILIRDKSYIFIESIFWIFACINFLIGTEKTQMLLYDPIYLIGFILGLISCFVIATCIRNINRRNEKGYKILGEIEGFKEFLKNAKKEDLELLVIENPNYFYDMLPYATMFRMRKIWIKKFEDIKIKEVDWYEDKNGNKDIKRFVYSTYGRIEDVMLRGRIRRLN